MMDKATLAALKGSVKKWEAIVAGTGVDDGIANCPLCEKFWADGCKGCPVAESSGMTECFDTPYGNAKSLMAPIYGISLPRRVTNPAALAAAQAELDFLKSLLPEPSADQDEVGP